MEEGKLDYSGKIHWVKKRTKNKLSLFVILSPGLGPRSHWFKMIAAITTSSLFSNSG